mmetsp:Transcript_32501/g.52584  ORF Transcript_32501/g.52584 Transcript_32501/m.52584 type:complete len:94 (+) Transcript_32501:115-396(+)
MISYNHKRHLDRPSPQRRLIWQFKIAAAEGHLLEGLSRPPAADCTVPHQEQNNHHKSAIYFLLLITEGFEEPLKLLYFFIYLSTIFYYNNIIL